MSKFKENVKKSHLNKEDDEDDLLGRWKMFISVKQIASMIIYYIIKHDFSVSFIPLYALPFFCFLSKR